MGLLFRRGVLAAGLFCLVIGCSNNGQARSEESLSSDLGGAFDFGGLVVLPENDDGEPLEDDIEDYPYSSGVGSVDEDEAGGQSDLIVANPAGHYFTASSASLTNRQPSQDEQRLVSPASDSTSVFSGDGSSSAVGAQVDAAPGSGDLVSAGRIEAMSFSEAKAAVQAALTDPQFAVPYKVKWPGQGVLALVSEPEDPLLKRLWAALMQIVSYGLQCTTEFRELRAMDKREKPPNMERLQQLRTRATRCMRKMRGFLQQQQHELNPLFDQEPQSRGFAHVKELLQALLEIGGCLERRAEVTTSYFSVFKDPSKADAARKLKDEREMLLREYAKLKKRLASATQQCEALRLLPRVCFVLKLM